MENLGLFYENLIKKLTQLDWEELSRETQIPLDTLTSFIERKTDLTGSDLLILLTHLGYTFSQGSENIDFKEDNNDVVVLGNE